MRGVFAVMPDHNDMNLHEMDLEQGHCREKSESEWGLLQFAQWRHSPPGEIHHLPDRTACHTSTPPAECPAAWRCACGVSSLRAIFLHCCPKFIDAHSWIVSRFHFGAAPPGCGDAVFLRVVHSMIIQRVAKEADQFRPVAIAKLRHKICDFRGEHAAKLARPSVF